MGDLRKLKHYEILSELGEGGMGVVYRARDTRLGRTVALKVLPKDFAEDDERSSRFEREAKIASALSHPGIATLLDFDSEGSVSFLAMELVKGSNLRELLKEGALPVERVLECGAQVAEALVVAHETGVVHRDLKPENIMAADSGFFKVLDFGVARMDMGFNKPGTQATQTPTQTFATRAGSLVGTVAYMSPEQLMGHPTIASSDIFSLGSLLYELITGQPAFSGNNEIAMAHAIGYLEPQPIQDLVPDVPPALSAVIARCLRKRPDERYGSARELAEHLRAIQQGRGDELDPLAGLDPVASPAAGFTGHNSGLASTSAVSNPGAVSTIRPPAKPSGRRKWWIGAGLVAMVSIVAAVAVMMSAEGQPDPPAEAAVPTPPDPTLNDLVNKLNDTATGALQFAEGRGARGAVSPAAMSPALPRVIVSFFESNSQDSAVQSISRGLPEMLTTDLSRAEGLDVIATQRLYDLLAQAGGEASELDRASTTQLARWAGADIVVTGSLFQVGESYRIDAQAYDTRTGSVLTAQKAQGTDLFALVAELTEALLGGLAVDKPVQALPERFTVNPEAMRAFVRGKREYKNLRFDEAVSSFDQALVLDPKFAPANFHRVMGLLASQRQDEARAGLETLQVELLPPAEKRLAQSLQTLYGEGDAEEGLQLLEGMAREFPQDGEVYVWWAKALEENQASPLRIVEKLRKAIALDSNNLHAVASMADQMAQFGEHEAAAKMLEQAQRRNPEAEAAIVERIHRLER